MEHISIFDIFKIGVGPSSSHTLGPWKAAQHFAGVISAYPIARVKVHLYGSLSKTGKGHGTDIAIMMGIQGHDPKTVDTSKIDEIIHAVRANEVLIIGDQEVPFEYQSDLIFERESLPHHPNAMTLEVVYQNRDFFRQTYYSVGGGFIEKEGEEAHLGHESNDLPYPCEFAADLLEYTDQDDISIAEVVYRNERTELERSDILGQIDAIFQTMLDCVYQGCHSDGILPGGLNVQRRAKKLAERLPREGDYSNAREWLETIKNTKHTFTSINNWVSCFALAVNEENADFGRIVTSPTNGAAGVIPAVLLYYLCFCEDQDEQDLYKFFLTAGEVGAMFKKRATISAALGGCQAEIGVSSAMAAAGLTELLGGSPGQALMAAEIAMEHHLGLTCDPIGGLVQIPCIERNAMGAMKAITACNLALSGNPDEAIVNFDTVVKTMWQTAKDMNLKYKETAEGGLAINLPVILPNC